MIVLFKAIRTVLLVIYGASSAVLTGAFVLLLYPFFGSGKQVDILSRLWSRLFLKVCRVKFEVDGLENIDRTGRYVFIANHQSTMDIPVCVASIPFRIRMLAKKELFRLPIFGWAMSAAGYIKIDRQNKDKAIANINRAVDRLENEDISPLIYAEGTRSPDGNIGKFKKGGFVLAIQAKRPVVPVTIQGSRQVLSKNSYTIIPGVVRVYVDKPVSTEDYGFNDRDNLAEEVRRIIVERFNALNKNSEIIKEK